jgi:hypothetical protein
MHWFAVPNNKQLTALGLDGPHVFGLNATNAFELRGETAGNVLITPEQIVRARIGFYETRSGRFFRTKLWTTLTDKPIELQPTPASKGGYALVITQFAEMMIAQNKRDRVETGSTKFDAVFGPTLIGIPTLVAFILALFVLTNEPWWGRMIVPLVPSIIFGLLTWMGVKRYWPRVLLDVRQLTKQLPPTG